MSETILCNRIKILDSFKDFYIKISLYEKYYLLNNVKILYKNQMIMQANQKDVTCQTSNG